MIVVTSLAPNAGIEQGARRVEGNSMCVVKIVLVLGVSRSLVKLTACIVNAQTEMILSNRLSRCAAHSCSTHTQRVGARKKERERERKREG